MTSAFQIGLDILPAAMGFADLVLSTPGKPAVTIRNLSRSQLQRAIEPLRARSNTAPSHATLADVGKDLFRWIDGDARHVSNILASVPNGTPAIHLRICAAHDMAELPWELLHDGRRFLIDDHPVAVLPIRCKRTTAPTPAPPANRPMALAFMAASAEGHGLASLDFEAEEAAILHGVQGTADAPTDIQLFVEESGTSDGLKEFLALQPDPGFDVVHLTGHAGHSKNGHPVFVFEDAQGAPALASPADVAEAIGRRPRLLFLSACLTGSAAASGQSMAGELLERGFPAVLGWARPVRDRHATTTAAKLYRKLGNGMPLDQALLEVLRELRDAKKELLPDAKDPAPDWHLLRLFAESDVGCALVTSPRAADRHQPKARPAAESDFLDPVTRTVRVAGRTSFVGRRRLLQRALRDMQQPPMGTFGVLLHGQGGRGKSSLAARVCERIAISRQRVVIHGPLRLDLLLEGLINGLPPGQQPALKSSVFASNYPPDISLGIALAGLREARCSPPLIVLDDFEQNQPNAERGDLGLTTDAAQHLEALMRAIKNNSPAARILITGRYLLPPGFAARMVSVPVPPMESAGVGKLVYRLSGALPPEAPKPNEDILAEARRLADGNPRLFKRLFKALNVPGMGVQDLLNELDRVANAFREEILLRKLVAVLTPEARALLGRLLLLELPVPRAVVDAAAEGSSHDLTTSMLERATGLGLMDVYADGMGLQYRVPRQLLEGNPALIATPRDAELRRHAGRLLVAAEAAWWPKGSEPTEAQLLELLRLASWADDKPRMARAAALVTTGWLHRNAYGPTRTLLKEDVGVDHLTSIGFMNLARAELAMGEGEAAGTWLERAEHACLADTDADVARVKFYRAAWLEQRGRWEEALRILTEDLLPVFERLGDVRSRAVTQGKIADILKARGELEEALRIRKEEELAVYERLGDVHQRAVTQGKIADILMARGELEEALRILTEDLLPVFERLGDVHQRAVTQGKIADILKARGELEEALRIRKEEELAVYERLGDVRSLIVGRTKLALLLIQRGRGEDEQEIIGLLVWSFFEARRRGFPEADTIMGILGQLGVTPELLATIARGPAPPAGGLPHDSPPFPI